MPQKKIVRPEDCPGWFDGKTINEALFCHLFLLGNRIAHTEHSFFTPEGKLTDEDSLRTQIFDVLTVEYCVDLFVSVQKEEPWEDRIRPDSLSDLSLQGEFLINIQYLSDRTGIVAAVGTTTGSMIAGLYRHMSVCIYVTRRFCFIDVAQNVRKSVFSFSKMTGRSCLL